MSNQDTKVTETSAELSQDDSANGVSSYIRIETDSRSKVISLIEEVIESPILNRIYTQKLSNNNYEVSIIKAVEEPAIISS